jgi:hypothetical protein
MTPRQHNGLPLNAKTPSVFPALAAWKQYQPGERVANDGDTLPPLIRIASAATQEACL